MLFEKSLRVAEGSHHWKCFSTLATLVWVRGAHYQDGSKRSGGGGGRHWKKLNKQWMEKEHTCHIVVHLGLHHWSFQLWTLYKSSSFTVNRSNPGETVDKEFCFPIREWSLQRTAVGSNDWCCNHQHKSHCQGQSLSDEDLHLGCQNIFHYYPQWSF